jgi:hypothetical protein
MGGWLHTLRTGHTLACLLSHEVLTDGASRSCVALLRFGNVESVIVCFIWEYLFGRVAVEALLCKRRL